MNATLNGLFLATHFIASAHCGAADITKTEIAVRGENLFLLGNFDSFTSSRVMKTLESSPEVVRIVFTANGGSEDDESVLELGHYIRSRGMDTHVIPGGVTASGGVSLFLAGNRRSIGEGAFVGVHSWANCSSGSQSQCKGATEFEPSDKAHGLHRDYTLSMLNDESFYWFSINAANPDSIHWVSDEELNIYKLTNDTYNQHLTLPFKKEFEEEYLSVCHNCPNAAR